MPRDYFRLLRPRQAAKNLLVFAGIIFGERWGSVPDWLVAGQTFLAFCAASSAVYIFNDVLDRDRDRLHPRKRHRPVASGAVSVPFAIVSALVLFALALSLTGLVNLAVLACVTAYAGLNLVYSMRLKHVPLVDVCCIGLGFVLRLMAGVYAINDVPTTWIALCTFSLAVFIGFAKRRAEFASLTTADDSGQRPTLRHYSVAYLDSLMGSSAVMAVLTYALFTTTSPKQPSLVATVPLVYYAIMHYKWLVLIGGKGEEPEHLVFRDWRLLATICAWFAAYFAIIRSDVHLFRH